MATLTSYTTYTYRLRAGMPMPLAGGGFVLHTFMAERSKIEIDLCETSLPSSSDFRGQGGELVSANFSRVKDKGGGEYYQGQRVYQPTFVSEGDY